jgi:hypothetical protein
MRAMRQLLILAVVAVLTAAALACSRTQALERMAPGTDVTILTRDGNVVRGKLKSVGSERVVLTGERAELTTEVARSNISDVHPTGDGVAAPRPREIVVPSNTTMNVELETALASNANRVEDVVRARVSAPVMASGTTVIPEGSELLGFVTVAKGSAKVKGRAELGVRFDRVRVGSVTYDIRTEPLYYVAPGTKKDDAAKVGIGAAAGAVIGAITGGKKGAAIGSAVGAGGGTAVVLATPGEEIRLSSGRRLRVALVDPLTIRVK